MNGCQIPFLLLVADDSPDDRLLIQEAWREVSSVELQIVGNGEELMDFLYRRGRLNCTFATQPDFARPEYAPQERA